MVGVAGTMTWSLSVPPLSSKLTPVTFAYALASKSAPVPDWRAPFEGMSTSVVGG